MKQLILRYEDTVYDHDLESLLEGIKQQGHSLPSVINVYVDWIYYTVKNTLLQFWSTPLVLNYHHLKLAYIMIPK